MHHHKLTVLASLSLSFANACVAGAPGDDDTSPAASPLIVAPSYTASSGFYGWEASWYPLGYAGERGGQAIVASGGDRLDLFRVSNGRLYWRRANDGRAWTVFEDIGGGMQFEGAPAAVSYAHGWVAVFARSPAGELRVRVRNEAGWFAWERLGDAIGSDPVAAVVPAGGVPFVEVYVRGTDGALHYRRSAFTIPGTWEWWQRVPGDLAGAPAVASAGEGRVDVVVTERATQRVLHRKRTAAGWDPGWTYLNGLSAATPAVVSPAPGRLDVVVTGTDLGLYHARYDGGAWGGFARVPGVVDSNPGGGRVARPVLATWGPGAVQLFVQGTDHAVYHYTYSWYWGASQRVAASAYPFDVPAVVAMRENRIDLAVVDVRGNYFHRAYGWMPSLPAGSGPAEARCGEADSFCCGGDVCGAGKVCHASDFRCSECGTEGRYCCAGRACGAGLHCVGDGIGGCQPCGATGQVCCNAGSPCASGVACQNGTCPAPPPPPPPPPPCVYTPPTQRCGNTCPEGQHVVRRGVAFDDNGNPCTEFGSYYGVRCEADCGSSFQACGTTCPAGYRVYGSASCSFDCGDCSSGANAVRCVRQ